MDINEKYSDLFETTLESEVVFEGRVFNTIVKKVELPNGKISSREIVKHNGGACILPIDDDLNCYMVRQFRSPFEKLMLEVPAGKLEIGEDPRECAIRELREETGFVADEVTDLGKFICSPGYDSEVISVYAARKLTFVGDKLDEGEFLRVEKIPLKELALMADRNEITDGKTLLAIYKSLRRFGFEHI